MKKSIFIITALFILAGCSMVKKDITPEPESVGMPNPASVYCEENGGTLEIREEEAGQYGACVFPDGSECEEWAFYRGECQFSGQADGESMNEQEAKEMAQQYITGMKEYTENNGYHMEEIDTRTAECPGCYDVSYEFRMRDQDSADIIGVADVTVVIRAGKITKVIYLDDVTGEEKDLPVQESPLIGGQKDEYGCLTAAGYSWCEATQKCQRLWEDPCIEDPSFNTDIIGQAFLKKYPDWDLSSWNISINKQYGEYAAGNIVPTDEGVGGAYFFAAKTADGWVIAADGNGNIVCSEIEPYNFPSDMIPECWDDVNMIQVQR